MENRLQGGLAEERRAAEGLERGDWGRTEEWVQSLLPSGALRIFAFRERFMEIVLGTTPRPTES